MRIGTWWHALSVVFLLPLLSGTTTAQEVKNLAATAAGGRIVAFSSQYDDGRWSVSTFSTAPAATAGELSA